MWAPHPQLYQCLSRRRWLPNIKYAVASDNGYILHRIYSIFVVNSVSWCWSTSCEVPEYIVKMGYTVKWGLHDRHTPEWIKFMDKLFSVWQNNSSGLWRSCFENQSRANTHDMSNQILNSKFNTSTSTTMVLNLVSIWAASSLDLHITQTIYQWTLSCLI